MLIELSFEICSITSSLLSTTDISTGCSELETILELWLIIEVFSKLELLPCCISFNFLHSFLCLFQSFTWHFRLQ